MTSSSTSPVSGSKPPKSENALPSIVPAIQADLMTKIRCSKVFLATAAWALRALRWQHATWMPVQTTGRQANFDLQGCPHYYYICQILGLRRYCRTSIKQNVRIMRFGAYFAEQYASRWPALLRALSQPSSHVGLLNSFAGGDCGTGTELLGIVSQFVRDWPPDECSRGNIRLVTNGNTADCSSYPAPTHDAGSGLLQWYWMDLASLLPPLMLDVHPGQRVYDACAAPGGKSLVLAHMMFGNTVAGGQWTGASGFLTCNDSSRSRRIRLNSVIKSYLPSSLLGRGQHIHLTGQPADSSWGIHEEFDRILVDAPCSSERHIIHQRHGNIDEIDREEWSVAKCRRLSKIQIKMIRRAHEALKVGGRMVYSTCSLDFQQNDKVIEKLKAKLGDKVAIVSHQEGFAGLTAQLPWPFQMSEEHDGHLTKTDHGWLALPDSCGWGPLYVSVLEKSS